MSLIPFPCRGQIFVYLNLCYSKRIFSQSYRRYLSWQCGNFVKNESSLSQCLVCKGNVLHFPVIRRLRIRTNAAKKVCWNCNQNVEAETIFCDSCSCLLPVDKHSDLFQIIGVDSTFKISQKELKQKYRSLQSLLHPDKFSSKSKKEQELSEEFSSIINKAYTTLLDPLERGLYLLKLQHVSIEEASTEMDKVFLMQIMELNEELENESSPQKLANLYRSNKEQIDNLVGQVEEAFAANNAKLAKELLTKMKYYYTIERKIKEIKQELNIPD